MRFGPILAALGLCLAVVACSGDNSRGIMNREDMLAASGFKFVPANTPERQAAFSKLPPHKFVREVRGDKVLYVYADPTICVCLYVGGQKAFGAYRARVFDQRIADEQVTVANDLYYMNGWNWGVWSAGYPVGWPYIDSIYNY
jgi:hypothetical protein